MIGKAVNSAVAAHISRKNGIDERAISTIDRPLMPCSTKRLEPTGGVTCASSIMMMM